jgi:hypothetical protein
VSEGCQKHRQTAIAIRVGIDLEEDYLSKEKSTGKTVVFLKRYIDYG